MYSSGQVEDILNMRKCNLMNEQGMKPSVTNKDQTIPCCLCQMVNCAFTIPDILVYMYIPGAYIDKYGNVELPTLMYVALA